jgi:hypothetical protein
LHRVRAASSSPRTKPMPRMPRCRAIAPTRLQTVEVAAVSRIQAPSVTSDSCKSAHAVTRFRQIWQANSSRTSSGTRTRRGAGTACVLRPGPGKIEMRPALRLRRTNGLVPQRRPPFQSGGLRQRRLDSISAADERQVRWMDQACCHSHQNSSILGLWHRDVGASQDVHGVASRVKDNRLHISSSAPTRESGLRSKTRFTLPFAGPIALATIESPTPRWPGDQLPRYRNRGFAQIARIA